MINAMMSDMLYTKRDLYIGVSAMYTKRDLYILYIQKENCIYEQFLPPTYTPGAASIRMSHVYIEYTPVMYIFYTSVCASHPLTHLEQHPYGRVVYI